MTKLYTSNILVCFFLFILSLDSNAQANAFFNKGGLVYLKGGSSDVNPTLYVNGRLTNQDGRFVNDDSKLELAGDFHNNPSSYNYESTGTELFSGAGDQTIRGTFNGTTGNDNQFYNLKIKKTSATGEYIFISEFGTNANINAAGSLEFVSTNGIIRTQSTGSTSPYTGNYARALYIQNPSASAITGHSTSAGATTKYIEGKLIREVNASDTYFFPIGVEKTGLDGMEAISINMNALSMPAGSTTGLQAYIRPANTLSYSSDLIANGDVLFYDIGGYDVLTNNNHFSQCVSGPEGYDDVALIDGAITHEWMVTPTVAPTSVSYDLTVVPGSTLENQVNYAVMGTACNSLYPKAQYLARDGRIGGNSSFGPTYIFDVPNLLGLVQAPTLKTITGQNGFSRFRLFGASDNNTSLPVELMSFTISPINNEYFILDWKTASELNNSGFFVQRSTNGITFETIGWIDGNGNSNSMHAYSFHDRNVEQNITYYYRLKQVDFNQNASFSATLSGILKGENFEVNSITPNPTNVNAEASIFMPENGSVEINIFNILGQNVQTSHVDLSKGLNKVTIESASLAPATYLIKFQMNDKTITKKLLKNL